MIIWRSKGYLVFVVVFLNSLIAEIISEAIAGNDRFYQANIIPFGCSLLLSAYVLNRTEHYFIQKNTVKGGIPKSNQKLYNPNQHQFFFIPLRYWVYILLALGVGLIIWQSSL